MAGLIWDKVFLTVLMVVIGGEGEDPVAVVAMLAVDGVEVEGR